MAKKKMGYYTEFINKDIFKKEDIIARRKYGGRLIPSWPYEIDDEGYIWKNKRRK